MIKKGKKIEDIGKLFSKVKNFPKTEEEFLETICFHAVMTESFVAQKLAYARWLGYIPYGTVINEEAVVKEIKACPFFTLISLYITQMSENLNLSPHPEDGIKAFREWFGQAVRKYNSRSTYHKLFELMKKERSIIVCKR